MKKREKQLTIFIMKQKLQKPAKVGKTETTTIHESNVQPFQIIEQKVIDNDKEQPTEENRFRIGACGQYMSDKVFENKEEAESYIDSKPWELIINLNYLTIKLYNEYEESKS